MNSKLLKRLIQNIIKESLILQKHSPQNLLLVKSNESDSKKKFNDTFYSKDTLKKSGFKWEKELNSWAISLDKFEYAKSIINNINRKEKFIKALEELEEYVEDSSIENVNKKHELAKKIQDFIIKLSEDVDDATASEEIRKFLEFGMKFRQFSFSNQMLIYMQRPDATQCAGYNQWQTEHNRHVKKGAKAIFIRGRSIKKGNEKDNIEVDNTDDKSTSYVSWPWLQIYDISDTAPLNSAGEIPPKPKWHDNNTPSEKADAITKASLEMMEDMGIKVGNEDAKGNEMGWSRGNHINISSNISGINKLATLIHEIAHELMHFDKSSIFYVLDDESKDDVIPRSFLRTIFELQAESVSYVVLRYYDFPVNHQANYLALWKANKQSIQKNSDIIRKVSNFIIKHLDEILERK